MLSFDEIHSRIEERQGSLVDWHRQLRKDLPIPIYTSIDIRDSGWKIASVDANVYPAGFNNICEVDREGAGSIAKSYIRATYGEHIKKIALITEEHTQNAYYWQNVYSLKKIFRDAGYEVELAFPRRMQTLKVETAQGQTLDVHGSFTDSEGRLLLENSFAADLVLTNNDFSDELRDWAADLSIPLNPPREMGWFQRKKSRHFEHYNEIAGEFADIIGAAKEQFLIKTELFRAFDINDEQSKNALADRVDHILADLQEQYRRIGRLEKPMLFVKNNSGTYGLAVHQVGSGDEIRSWNYKSRKRMKAAKGGNKVEELILQEGIPSRMKHDGAVAEPVVYLLGCQLLGGFLRTHKEKGDSDSLNSPGAVYQRMCMSDLLLASNKAPLENVYGWIGRISSLAVGREIRDLGLQLTATKCV